jgi:creatinine amidohydrolase
VAPAAAILEDISWVEAEAVLNQDTVIVIPLGAAAKEHGPHLKLNNDWRLAEYLKQQVARQAGDKVVIAPTLSYFFYPSFVEYPGSISLSLETAQFVIIDICMSLSAFGPRRFYVLNTGVSTLKSLRPAAADLLAQGILLRFTDLAKTLAPVTQEVAKQEGGSHADEIETSIMLAIAPESVDMTKAGRDFDPRGQGRLTRTPGTQYCYSPSGIWGDTTLATAEKGKRIVQSLVVGVLHDIDELSRAPLPSTVSG